jgi:hypothetical protein
MQRRPQVQQWLCAQAQRERQQRWHSWVYGHRLLQRRVCTSESEVERPVVCSRLTSSRHGVQSIGPYTCLQQEHVRADDGVKMVCI